MNNQVFISLYLDTRRSKASGKYPLKLRVFTKQPRMQKLYNINLEYSEKEYQSTWLTSKPRSEYREARLRLQAIENMAVNIANSIKPFSIDAFERKLYRKAGEGINVFFYYHNHIDHLVSSQRYSTASTFEFSMKSLIAFLSYEKSRQPDKLSFYDITPDWLSKYENYMINILERSRTTVSIYLRVLKSVFNDAINDKEIEPEIYPFGKKKYQIPSVKQVKKVLTGEQLRILYRAKAINPIQQMAKDFWFFSYSCNGMNVKDILLLKYSNLEGDRITFYRAKTINTSKANLKPITVYLNDFTRPIIEKYGNINTGPHQYIFSILSKEDSPLHQHKKIKNFTRLINQNLKKLAVSIGLPKEISTYWARHSFTTISIRNGAKMELIGEALGHSSIKTTQAYFEGFEDQALKELAQQNMDFII